MYIHECATNLAVSEELIVNEINKQHRLKQQQEAKKNNPHHDHNTPQVPTSDPTDQSGIQQLLATNAELAEERILISLVIRYGNLPMDVTSAPDSHDVSTKADNAQWQQVCVAQYINNDLNADGLALRNELYKKVMNEALQHCVQPEWSALPYFLNHPDPEISQLATDVGQDNFILSSKQREMYVDDKYRLDDLVPRILHDYKHSIVKEQLKHLLTELRNPQLMTDPEKAKQLMQQYMEISMIERELAKVLGDRVILKYGNKM